MAYNSYSNAEGPSVSEIDPAEYTPLIHSCSTTTAFCIIFCISIKSQGSNLRSNSLPIVAGLFVLHLRRTRHFNGNVWIRSSQALPTRRSDTRKNPK